MQLHPIAAGAGWTYEMMTGDVRETNYSSARVRRLDYKREAEQEQWLHVIPLLLEPLVRAFANAAALAGAVRTASYDVRYSPPRWDYVNPKDDVASDAAEIAAGLDSISAKIRARGEDPQEKLAEITKDIKTLQDSGVLPVLLAMQKSAVRTDTGDQGKTGDKTD